MTEENAEKAQHAAMASVHREIVAAIKKYEAAEPDRTWGYTPRLATRKRGNTIPARELRAGDRVRVGAPACPIGWSTVLWVWADPGCPWNGAYPARTWAILDGWDDELLRLLRVLPGDLVEVESAS